MVRSAFGMTDKPPKMAIQRSQTSTLNVKTQASTQSAKVLFQSKSRPRFSPLKWLLGLSTGGLLLAATVLVSGSGWLAFQLLLYPDTVIWLNRYLPAWTKIPIKSRDPLLTMPEILANIRQAGLVPGEIIPLIQSKDDAKNAPNLLILVRNSQGQIVELRVYQPERGSPYLGEDEKFFWPVSQIEIAGPQESFVIAPLVNARSSYQGSSRALPLTDIQQFKDGPLPPGIWFNLTGTWAQADRTVPYGTIVHYNPDRAHLSLMLQWASPAGEAPQWINLAGDKNPELLINQTVGLEPQFILQQIQPRRFLPNPIHLQPISFNEATPGNKAYQNALVLARSGLWTPSLDWFKVYKRQAVRNKKLWNSVVQAQMALVEVHARVTTSQAEKTWASPSDQVLVNLIDGRWKAALTTYEKADDISEILALLRSDTGRLRRRVTAALRINPTQVEVQAWGALLIEARQGRTRSIAWLQQQARLAPTETTRIYRLLDKMEASIYTENAANTSHVSQIIGTASPASSVTPQGWLRPDAKTPLQLGQGETWYQVQVVAFQDGIRWRKAPFTGIKLFRDIAAQQLWDLMGLDSDPQISLATWDQSGTQQTITGTVKAVRLNGKTLQLLIAGEPFPKLAGGKPAKLFAFTNSSLQWLDPNNLTWADFSQQQPDVAPKVWRTLVAELKRTGQLSGNGLTPEQLLQQEGSGELMVKEIDLTGNQSAEFMVVLDKTLFSNLFKQNSRFRQPKTMIFSDLGNLIYSEFSTEGAYSLTGIADIGDGGTSALILESSNGFHLWRWVQKKRHFE